MSNRNEKLVEWRGSLKRIRSMDSFRSKEEKKTLLIMLLSYLLLGNQEKYKNFMEYLRKEGIMSEEECLMYFQKGGENLLNYKKHFQLENDINYPFQKIRKIGEGSFGEVFQCKHEEDDKQYAIKKICTESSLNPDKNEIKILSSLEHKNIIRYFSSWIHLNYLYIQMEYCPLNLREYMRKEERNERFMKELLDGLEYLHKMNFIHFDLKPENVLISKDERVKIADFGYSRSFLSEIYNKENYSPSLYICGKDDKYEPSMDIYSYGIIFLEYNMLYCKTNMERLINIRLFLKNRDWGLKKNWNRILDGCLCEDQKERITIKEIKRLIE